MATAWCRARFAMIILTACCSSFASSSQGRCLGYGRLMSTQHSDVSRSWEHTCGHLAWHTLLIMWLGVPFTTECLLEPRVQFGLGIVSGP